MTQQEIMDVFIKLGVLKTGHFRLTSGLHSKEYMQELARHCTSERKISAQVYLEYFLCQSSAIQNV